MEGINEIISECDKKLDEQRRKLDIFDGRSDIRKLTADEASVISEVSINLFFMLDKFPIILLETLGSKELEEVNRVESEIKVIQSRIMDIVGTLEV